jgi:hypothetical protein
VTVRFGRVCIVNFLHRSLSCPVALGALTLSLLRDGVFRAGWTVNQGRVYRRSAPGSGEVRSSHVIASVLMQICPMEYLVFVGAQLADVIGMRRSNRAPRRGHQRRSGR